MEKIFAEKRTIKGRKTKKLKESGVIPAILYGKSIDPIKLSVKKKDFLKTYIKIGASSMAELNIDKKKYLVLTHAVQRNIIANEIIHIDFYQPQLKEKITIHVPIVFEGVAPAIKEFSGTFVNNMKEIEIKAFPLDFPHDIKVDISSLITLEDAITIGDLKLSEKLEIIQDKNNIIASVVSPEDVDAELEKTIGDVESVETEKPEKEKDEIE